MLIEWHDSTHSHSTLCLIFYLWFGDVISYVIYIGGANLNNTAGKFITVVVCYIDMIELLPSCPIISCDVWFIVCDVCSLNRVARIPSFRFVLHLVTYVVNTRLRLLIGSHNFGKSAVILLPSMVI